MTTLGSLLKGGKVYTGPIPPPAQPLDIPSLTAALLQDPYSWHLGTGIQASLQAWVNQDDDAHEPCSLTACRHPLHPGPCKGWKGTLNQVSPGTYKQIEEARVRKANARRVARIADLKAQGKPIPRKMLEPIKEKPAPAHGAQPVPLGQVNQKADLAGGQAHTAGQAVSNAAGVAVKTAPLPLGPKQKKPTIAGRGPAFVITQPKVTDTYKLDKADKITLTEWAGLSDHDKKTIRNELTAIKARGFGPQQTKADALLAKLPAPGAAQKATPAANPGSQHQATPGKVSLAQAIKNTPKVSGQTATQRATQVQQAMNTPQLPAPAPSPSRGSRDQNGILNKPVPGGSVSSTSVGLPSGYRISRDGMGYSLTYKAPGSVFGSKTIRTSNDQAALETYAKKHHALAAPILAKHKAAGTSANAELAKLTSDKVDAAPTPQSPQATPPTHAAALTALKDGMTRDEWSAAGGNLNAIDALVRKGVVVRDGEKTVKIHGQDVKQATYRKATPGAAPAAAPSAAPSAPDGGVQPSAPLPATATAQAKHAAAVASRAAPKSQTAKEQVDAYGKLTKADFDTLTPATQKTIRDDLANAKAKFLDPKKQQAAADLLDRFGSRHTTPAAAVPVTGPPSAKGYSDPVAQAVKAADSGLVSTDDVIKTAGRLSPDSIKGLDDADRKKILGRLAFVATHPKATVDQKAQAAAIGRMINTPSPALTARKWDHTPTFAELHAEEKKLGLPQVAAALKAAGTDGITMDRADRLKALSGLTPAQFKALSADEQRKITNALHYLHTDQKNSNSGTQLDQAAADAIEHYTGLHPGIHAMREAEADFRAGKIDADAFHRQFLHARVASLTKTGHATSPGAELAKEAQRIAEDNPTLPTWLRAELIDNPYSGYTGTYSSISMAQNRYNWADAPRLSTGDINDLFRATTDELAKSHPIHAQAVKELREHVLRTGLKGQPGVPSGSPWSLATRNHTVDSLLHINGGSGNDEIPAERLKEFKSLPADVQITVERVLRDRITAQTNDHAKTATWLQANQLGGRQSVDLTPEQLAAATAASDRFARPDLGVYRKLDPAEFDKLEPFTRKAIDAHLNDAQTRAERGGPIRTFSGTENMLELFPGALKDHLNGMRTGYADRRTRQASDIANFGTKIINPRDRTRVYSEVPITQFQQMAQGDQDLIHADLDTIARDRAIPMPVRYDAQLTKDVRLTPAATSPIASHFDAILAANPKANISDSTVEMSLANLSKADFDSLPPAFRDAIDARIATLPASSQQFLSAKYHPQAAPTSPAGFTPTAGTVQTPLPPHVQAAVDTIYGVHNSGKSHTMAHQLSTYGALRGSDFNQLNGQEQGHLLGDLSFIATTAKGPSADKARKLIDRFSPPGTPAGQVPTGAAVPPVNAVAGQVRYATPLKGLAKAKDSGTSGDGWISLPGGQRVWGAHGAAGLLLSHDDPQTGERRYLMVQRGPAISDPGKWTFPGGASDSKETPHEGATRETIEELGLKDDVFKDALVHGDHTFTVPGSTWKYTTVAASVPTMIKPNLTTAHARAETSDAKWMTLSEIQALDKSGKLHHPIAGGKLEQNVISLFPAAGGQTLGQIVRPGPVTKRQNRLRMPAGGRQAPSGSNAYTAPHKPSKGKNLVTDKTAIDKIRQDIKHARKAYDGKTADGRLAAIGNMQGFDDTPTVAPKSEIDRLLATGDYIEVFRGVSGSGGRNWRSGNSGGKTAAQINEEMRSGPAYYGKGIFGNGYYLATQRSVATQYADGTKNSVARMLIPKSAVTEDYPKIEKEAHAASSRQSKAKGGHYEEGTLYDPGRWAAAKGLDGIKVEHNHTNSTGGWARHVAKPGQPAFNWLNRSVLIIQEAD